MPFGHLYVIPELVAKESHSNKPLMMNNPDCVLSRGKRKIFKDQMASLFSKRVTKTVGIRMNLANLLQDWLKNSVMLMVSMNPPSATMMDFLCKLTLILKNVLNVCSNFNCQNFTTIELFNNFLLFSSTLHLRTTA